MKSFSSKTIVGIKYYVYGLKDPRNNKYFYIGMGQGNRVFTHLKNPKSKNLLDPKADIIDQLKKTSNGPAIDIIRHGLSHHEATLLESCLIDVFDVNQLTNKVRGVDANIYGLMSPKNVEAYYKAKDFKLNIKAICFKINKAWLKNMTEEELYKSIREHWYINIKKAEKVEYGIGVYHGIIRGIYKIDRWEINRSYKPNRHRFYGRKALQNYLGYNLNHYPKSQVRGPLFYYNV